MKTDKYKLVMPKQNCRRIEWVQREIYDTQISRSEHRPSANTYN